MHPPFAYVGCFTTEKRKASGKGVAVFSIHPDTGRWTFIHACDSLHNPHWVCLDGTQQYLYSAHGDAGEVCAYARDRKTGKLTFLNKQPTDGNNSSYVEVDSGNRHIVLATGPGCAVFPINQDGSLGPYSDKVIPPGEPGPYRHEQKGPHPHQAPFDPSGGWVILPDKGQDAVHVYRFDADKGRLIPGDPVSVKSRYGAAPRHIAFHKTLPFAYLINELDSTLTAYRWDAVKGSLTPFQILPTTPQTYTGNNTGAEVMIAPSGKFVYVSNRGHNSILCCRIAEDGMLSIAHWEPVQGDRPRFFCLSPDGTRLFACNQDSNRIVEFSVDTGNGKITPTGQVIETGSPSCIAFATP
jgi:6-phosphogluconolactonase (cycloisomerase 2 family)